MRLGQLLNKTKKRALPYVMLSRKRYYFWFKINLTPYRRHIIITLYGGIDMGFFDLFNLLSIWCKKSSSHPYASIDRIYKSK